MLGHRMAIDKAFTVLACGAMCVVALALVVLLGPILWRGASAVFFFGTVEFRAMRNEVFRQGDDQAVRRELAEVAAVREPVYEMLSSFERGIHTDALADEAQEAHRSFRRWISGTERTADEERELKSLSRELRDTLDEAFESTDRAEVLAALDRVLAESDRPEIQGSPAMEFFRIARVYRTVAEEVDLTRRDQYAQALREVRAALARLFGPFPDEPPPQLVMNQFGATRWDKARRAMDDLMWAEEWIEETPGEPLVKKRIPRAEQFAGTRLAPLFPYVDENLKAMLHPRFTVYLRYFTDDSTTSHFFGGIGPEILGTLLLTFLSITFALPLGVIAAAYLVECAGDNWVVVVIRTCINTLAGVPSIVFGLFGLAFFVIFLLPRLGSFLNMPSVGEGASVLAGALTLGVLVLPIIIRASEEAIRAVPPTYKEASLALGAGRFRAFMTVTLPAALPGILTGVILSMGRAAGETAPILFTAAVASGEIPSSLFQPTRALSYGSYDIAVGDRLAPLVPHQQYGMVATLVVLVLVLNLAAILIRARMTRRLRGE